MFVFILVEGSGIERFNDSRSSELEQDGPMEDYEIRKTTGEKNFPKGYFIQSNCFHFTCTGILHLKLPVFPYTIDDARKECLRKCYLSIMKKAVELEAKKIVSCLKFPCIIYVNTGSAICWM